MGAVFQSLSVLDLGVDLINDYVHVQNTQEHALLSLEKTTTENRIGSVTLELKNLI